jgi:hypothetical protein
MNEVILEYRRKLDSLTPEKKRIWELVHTMMNEMVRSENAAALDQWKSCQRHHEASKAAEDQLLELLAAPSPAQGTPDPPTLTSTPDYVAWCRDWFERHKLTPHDFYPPDMLKEFYETLVLPRDNGQGWSELKSLWAALKLHVWERKFDTGRDIETGFERDMMRLGKYIESLPAPPTGDAPHKEKP